MDQQEQQIQQQSASIQDKRKQKSLFWIITTIYLTMILSGLIIGAVLMILGSIIFAGLSGFAASFVPLLIMIVTYVIAIKIGVDYVSKRAFIKKEDIIKISSWVAILGLILYIVIEFFFRGLTMSDLVIIPFSAIVFFAVKYFLEKKVT